MSAWKDRIAVITGAASGIGRALSQALSARGARVVMTDVNEGGVRQASASLGGSEARALDVRDGAAVQALIDDVVAHNGRLDYLFNNAGIGVGGEIQHLTLAHWERILDVNVRGVIHGVAAAYPVMIRQRSGCIVNTASVAGLGPAPLLVPYAMSKHAVVGLSTSLRLEARDYGVRVCALCPGVIETPLLDSDQPADLPEVPGRWRPDVRRHLTKLAGPPYPVERLAEDTLAAIERDEGVIVIPARARLMWRLLRLMPFLMDSPALNAIREARREAGIRLSP